MTQLSFESQFFETQYYSISDLTREIKYLLEDHFPDVWIRGEVSNFKLHSSGHMYFSLKDDEAQIACAMWRRRNFRLRFLPEDGMSVLVNARISVFEKRGIYQLDVLEMQPVGVGELQFAFEQLKNRLRDEGLFSEESKKPIPRFPGRIGIVTSPTGAAIQDMLTVLRRRFPSIEVVLRPVPVQGPEAAGEIAAAIDEFNRFGRVDVLIIGRGGGSLEDLWAFNEESVARAIFRSRIPVISAVGHEVDYSISDFVADLRAPTPSAAAELAVPDRQSLASSIAGMRSAMTSAILEQIQYRREILKRYQRSYAFRQPMDLIYQHAQKVDENRRRLNQALSYQMKIHAHKVAELGNRLRLLGHENVLRRGYALCEDGSGRLVNSVSQLKPGDPLNVRFHDGSARTGVSEVTPK